MITLDNSGAIAHQSKCKAQSPAALLPPIALSLDMPLNLRRSLGIVTFNHSPTCPKPDDALASIRWLSTYHLNKQQEQPNRQRKKNATEPPRIPSFQDATGRFVKVRRDQAPRRRSPSHLESWGRREELTGITHGRSVGTNLRTRTGAYLSQKEPLSTFFLSAGQRRFFFESPRKGCSNKGLG